MHDQETPIDPNLSDVFQSDRLPSLLQLLRALTANSPGLLDVATFNIVLDANKIIGEIRWRLIHRQKPEARSPLFESIEAKVLIPFVPRQLEHEVLKYAEAVARKAKKPVDDYIAEFERIKPLLRFHETALQPLEVVELADPKDLVYMATREQLNLPAIYSTDPHFERMGAPLVNGRIDRDLRDYARGSAVSVGVSLGSGVVITVSIETIPKIFEIFKSVARWFVRQPILVQIGIASIVLSLAFHPRVRSTLAKTWKEYWPVLIDMMMPILRDYCDSQAKARLAHDRIQSALPKVTATRTALNYCQAVCFVGQSPRSTREIVRAMEESGYRSRSKRPADYVRSVLRKDDQFVEVRYDHWVQLPPESHFDSSNPKAYVIRPPKPAPRHHQSQGIRPNRS